MKGLKKIAVFLLLCSLPIWVFCQPVFPTNIDNVKENLLEIGQLYGSQIDVDLMEVREFLLPFLIDAASETDCPPPYPQINQAGNGSVSFSWAPIPSANYYGIYYMNLNTGETNESASDIPSADFNNLNGLYLFGFYSHCGDTKGPSNIIIVDVDIFHPTGIPPIARTCPCEQPESIALYDGLSSTSAQSNYFQAWPAPCENSKYRIRINGDVIDSNGGNTPYDSEVTFVHGNYTPHRVYLMSHCDNNAWSSSQDPLYVGSIPNDDYYNVSFNSSGIVVNLPSSELIVDNLILDVCRCRRKNTGDLEGGGRGGLVENQPSRFIAMPNPAGNFTELIYEINEVSEVSIAVYDVLGKKVQQVLAPANQAPGKQQIQVDMEDWPKGIYVCLLSTPSYQESISLIKK